MKLKIKNGYLHIENIFLLVIILCIIWKEVFKYFENYISCYLFIAFHEFSHMFIASIFGIKINELNICISGLNIKLGDYNRKGIKWLIIYFAGPVSNIILAVIFNNIPMVFAINMALAIMNLIPVFPLDGYHILEIVLNGLKLKKVKYIQRNIQNLLIVLLAILGIYQLINMGNPSLALMTVYIVIQSLNIKENHNSNLYQEYYKNVTKFE